MNNIIEFIEFWWVFVYVCVCAIVNFTVFANPTTVADRQIKMKKKKKDMYELNSEES